MVAHPPGEDEGDAHPPAGVHGQVQALLGDNPAEPHRIPATGAGLPADGVHPVGDHRRRGGQHPVGGGGHRDSRKPARPLPCPGDGLLHVLQSGGVQRGHQRQLSRGVEQVRSEAVVVDDVVAAGDQTPQKCTEGRVLDLPCTGRITRVAGGQGLVRPIDTGQFEIPDVPLRTPGRVEIHGVAHTADRPDQGVTECLHPTRIGLADRVARRGNQGDSPRAPGGAHRPTTFR